MTTGELDIEQCVTLFLAWFELQIGGVFLRLGRRCTDRIDGINEVVAMAVKITIKLKVNDLEAKMRWRGGIQATSSVAWDVWSATIEAWKGKLCAPERCDTIRDLSDPRWPQITPSHSIIKDDSGIPVNWARFYFTCKHPCMRDCISPIYRRQSPSSSARLPIVPCSIIWTQQACIRKGCE